MKFVAWKCYLVSAIEFSLFIICCFLNSEHMAHTCLSVSLIFAFIPCMELKK